MNIKGLRTFLPSIDFEISKQFYKDLGFDVQWENDEMCIFGSQEYNFFLQKYYQKEWAENVMMQIFVDDLEIAFNVAEELLKSYKNTKIKAIFEADYGKTFHLIDPAGVLWHFTEVRGEVIKDN